MYKRHSIRLPNYIHILIEINNRKISIGKFIREFKSKHADNAINYIIAMEMIFGNVIIMNILFEIILT